MTVLCCDDKDEGSASVTAVSGSTTAAPLDDFDFLIDSGASHHMCCDSRLFSAIATCNEKKICLGDTREVKCNQNGNVYVLLKPDKNAKPFWLRLTNVLYVPSLRINIISVSAMDNSCMHFAFAGGRCELSDARTHKHVSSGERRSDGLYCVRVSPKQDGNIVNHSTCTVSSPNPEQL